MIYSRLDKSWLEPINICWQKPIWRSWKAFLWHIPDFSLPDIFLTETFPSYFWLDLTSPPDWLSLPIRNISDSNLPDLDIPIPDWNQPDTGIFWLEMPNILTNFPVISWLKPTSIPISLLDPTWRIPISEFFWLEPSWHIPDWKQHEYSWPEPSWNFSDWNLLDQFLTGTVKGYFWCQNARTHVTCIFMTGTSYLWHSRPVDHILKTYWNLLGLQWDLLDINHSHLLAHEEERMKVTHN